MPIYEFACQNCGNEFEHIQSFSDVSVPACTSCGSDDVVRRLGRPAIHFKGSGWYITDSKKSQEKKATGDSKSESKSDGTKEAASSTESSATSDSSTAEKSDSKTSTAKESTTPVAAD